MEMFNSCIQFKYRAFISVVISSTKSKTTNKDFKQNPDF